MKRAIVALIILFIGYFIIGFALVYMRISTMNEYLTYSGILGGFASVIGLISLVKSSVTKDDIISLEANSLRSLAETSEQLRKLDQERAQARTEISDLEIQKKEMELLVKKASMALYLKEKYTQLIGEIRDAINSDAKLIDSLNQIRQIAGKLDALGEQIESDPNVELLKDIITQVEDGRNKEFRAKIDINDDYVKSEVFKKISAFIVKYF